jgi:hypothetical protein
MLENQRTMVLAFQQKTAQPEERFFLQISGIEDVFGNELHQGQWTIIDR